MAAERLRPRPLLTAALAALLLAAIAPLLLAARLEHFEDPLTLVLAVCALASVLTAARWEANVDISASFVCLMLAIAFLDPLAALAIAVFAELGSWLLTRSRPSVLPINLAATAVPSVLAAVAFDAMAGGARDGGAVFLVTLALVGSAWLVVNFVLVGGLMAIVDGLPLRETLRPPLQLAPALALTLALTLTIAEVYAGYGLAAAAFLILALIAFTYMARLLVTARTRAQQYASLSWGVLSGLVRTLDRRDPRTARHSAAVAAFARDIALRAGLDRREVELAHTAGLLHDIGRFAVSDRVMERGGTLRAEDWDDVRRHPALGADLLRDLGLYGPVAEIVRAHHERPDGRGYPDGLGGDEIPAIARIVAVAEVYDTLTAEDTYRTRMTSFEALTELRRVAGTQLDGRYVELLAELLAGRGVDYRHADGADFDRELAMERRIADAIGPDPAAGSGVAGAGATGGEPTEPGPQGSTGVAR